MNTTRLNLFQCFEILRVDTKAVAQKLRFLVSQEEKSSYLDSLYEKIKERSRKQLAAVHPDSQTPDLKRFKLINLALSDLEIHNSRYKAKKIEETKKDRINI